MALLFSLLMAAQGQTNSLRDIDALIDASEYNAALEQLTQFMREHPESFDAAQKRVHRIMTERLRFNADAQLLVDKMAQGGPGDDGTGDSEKVELIDGMEQSEVNRAPESVALTNDARRAITLQYYIMRANDIMEEGVALVGQGGDDARKYVQAAKKFQECFTLKKSTTDVVYSGDEAVPVTYDAATTGAVDRADAAIAEQVSLLSSLLDACERAVRTFLAAVETSDAPLSESRLALVEASFRTLASSRNKILSQARLLREQDDAVLRRYPALGTSYIAFSRIGVDGTADSPDTGIIAAIDAFWNTRTERMKAAVYRATLDTLDELPSLLPLEALWASSRTDDARLALGDAASFAATGSRVQALYSLLDDCECARFVEYSASMDFVRTLCGGHFAETGERVQGVADREPVEAVPSLAENSVRGILADCAFYEDTMALMRQYRDAPPLRAELEREENARRALSEAGNADAEPRTMPGVQVRDDVLFFDSTLSLYPAVLEQTEAECRRRLVQAWTALAGSYDADASGRRDGFEARLSEARAVSGTDAAALPTLSAEADGGVGADGAEFSVERYYPTKAAELLLALKADAVAGRQTVSGYRAVLSGGEGYRAEQTALDASITDVERVIAALDALIAACDEVRQAALSRANGAKLAAQEAASLYQRSQAALADNRFDEARELLSRARTRYSDSLLLEDDEALRAESDRRLAALDAAIADQQQRVIVVQTRALKNSARAAYYRADFESAERDLARARDLWAITNGDSEDREITDLLAMINTALSMRTGRSIPVTAPLYPEMSQILNQANRHYNDGEALMRQGKKADATAALKRAEEQVRKVQLVYPLNQEASLLSLRIERQLDPKAFERSFARRVNEAKANSNKQEAYASLTDLREINPTYPGLSELILNLEYETGIRQRPVDTTARKSAASKITQAQRVYNAAKGNAAELDKAVALLNEAISLNPEDSAATSLKDKIQIEAGARATDILSAADEAAYLVAIQELNKNNIITANAMVERLMRRGSNSRNKKLQLLQKRIKALM